mmetsp:Transcript_21044/g.23426  ORF Transcript_21044/g.23426 Transcript_21044/m.23426 type:complete len:102 (+) Transcript_21044:335-640(+)
MSMDSGDLRLSPNTKNKTTVHDFRLFSIDIGNEGHKELDEILNKSEGEQLDHYQLTLKDSLNSQKERRKIIDYESIQGDEEVSFHVNEIDQEIEMNCFDLY